jgi:hypothetical protein
MRNFPTVKTRLNQHRNFISISPSITTLNGRTGAPEHTLCSSSISTWLQSFLQRSDPVNIRRYVLKWCWPILLYAESNSFGPIHCLTHERKRERARERERERERESGTRAWPLFPSIAITCPEMLISDHIDSICYDSGWGLLMAAIIPANRDLPIFASGIIPGRDGWIAD